MTEVSTVGTQNGLRILLLAVQLYTVTEARLQITLRASLQNKISDNVVTFLVF